MGVGIHLQGVQQLPVMLHSMVINASLFWDQFWSVLYKTNAQKEASKRRFFSDKQMTMDEYCMNEMMQWEKNQTYVRAASFHSKHVTHPATYLMLSKCLHRHAELNITHWKHKCSQIKEIK